MGKGEGREGNKVSKPSSPAAYQPNNHPHPPQLHFLNPTQVPSIGNRGPPHSVGQNRVPVVLPFGSNPPPPSRTSRSIGPTTSTPAYPTPIRSPLPKSKPPHRSFVKTEPPQLGFRVLAQNAPPSRVSRSSSPTTSTPAYPTPTKCPLPKYEPPCRLFTKTKPRWLSFCFILIFGQ